MGRPLEGVKHKCQPPEAKLPAESSPSPSALAFRKFVLILS
jgi:hypothetical protein